MQINRLPASTITSDTTEDSFSVLANALSGTEQTAENPMAIRGEMDLIFNGSTRRQHLANNNALPEWTVPEWRSTLEKHVTSLKNSESGWSALRQRYTALRQELIERRTNYSIALEGPLQAEETFDLYHRLEQIHVALDAISDNLQEMEAWHKKQKPPKVLKEAPLQATPGVELSSGFSLIQPPDLSDVDTLRQT